MRILLTNDDGIHAPGLAAMERELRELGEVLVVAPSFEQSGVSQSITFLRPLVGHKVMDGGKQRGWAVDGTPADCVKLGVTQYSPEPPDLIVSGINGGLNAGINVLYSGTVGGAIEGALFGIPSFAVSLEFDEHAQFGKAAKMAREIIRLTLERKNEESILYNLNFPTAAMQQPAPVRVVPMATNRYGHHFIKRTDPKQRTYYWATNDPAPEPTDHDTDVMVLKRGEISLTPLHFDMTLRQTLGEMESWSWNLDS